MTTTKPTINTGNARQVRAISEARLYDVKPIPGNADRWQVERKGTTRRYVVNIVTGECSCPDHQYRGTCCRHFELVNLGLLLGELKTPAPVLSPAPRPMTAEQRRAAFFSPD